MAITEIVHLERGYTRQTQSTACGEVFPFTGGWFALHTEPSIRHAVTQIRKNVTCERCAA